jgi:hypothetical protein
VFSLAAAAALLLARTLGLSLPAQLFAAGSTLLATALTLNIARYNIADQNAFIPIQFAAVAWAAQRGRAASYAVLALVTTLTLTAGFVQTALVTVLIAGIFGLALIFFGTLARPDKLARIAGILVSSAVGICFAAPYLLPIVELAMVGFHKNVPSVVVYTPPLANLLAFLAPGMLGQPLAPGTAVDWDNLFATSNITVVMVCVVGAIALQWRDLRLRPLFWVLLLISLMFILRFMNLPPMSWLAELPGFGHQATKHTQSAAAFLLVIAGAIAVDQASDWNLRRAQIAMALTLCAALASAYLVYRSSGGSQSPLYVGPITALITYGSAALILSKRAVDPRRTSMMALLAVLSIAELSLYLPLGLDESRNILARWILLALIVSTGAFLLGGRKFLGALTAVLTLIAYCALIAVPHSGLPTLVMERKLPAFAKLVGQAAGPQYRTFGIFPDFSSQVPVQDVGVVGPMAPSGYAAFIRIIDPEGRLSYAGSTVLTLAGRETVTAAQYLRRQAVFDWLGVRYLVLERRLLTHSNMALLDLPDAAPSAFRTLYNDDLVKVIESLNAKPRFAFAADVRIARSQFSVIRRLQDAPASIGTVTWLDDTATSFIAGANTPNAKDEGEITIGESSANRIDLSVRAPGPRLLIVKNAYFPGWRASVDGHATPVLRVNGMVQGIAIATAGVHDVRLSYFPASFSYGAALAAAALFGFAFFLGALLWRPSAASAAAIAVSLTLAGAGAGMIHLLASEDSDVERLGPDDTSCAIDLRNVSIDWRRTDSTDAGEPFVRATSEAYLPTIDTNLTTSEIGLGRLVYIPDLGVREVDGTKSLKPVIAAEGYRVGLTKEMGAQVCHPSVEFTHGEWRLVD